MTTDYLTNIYGFVKISPLKRNTCIEALALEGELLLFPFNGLQWLKCVSNNYTPAQSVATVD